MGLSTGKSSSQIVPVIVGDPARAVGLSRRLLADGFLVPAIRPPTVPRGTSRLRVSLCAGHSESDVEAFVEALGAAMGEIE
jgi:8-amino-7-oxononanoate synthase